MSVIDRFQRVDAWLASVLPDWPLSLILLVSLLVGLALALLIVSV
jgi:hypothetical protein